VLAAHDVASAVAAARSASPPDVILADYHLDQETGLEAVIAVRNAVQASIPAIFITADHSPEVQRDLRRQGFTLLRKPVKAAALRALLTQYALRRAAAE
jgi:CheY-like chemotaxis protein